jgi:hypothetical protein
MQYVLASFSSHAFHKTMLVRAMTFLGLVGLLRHVYITLLTELPWRQAEYRKLSVILTIFNPLILASFPPSGKCCPQISR